MINVSEQQYPIFRLLPDIIWYISVIKTCFTYFCFPTTEDRKAFTNKKKKCKVSKISTGILCFKPALCTSKLAKTERSGNKKIQETTNYIPQNVKKQKNKHGGHKESHFVLTYCNFKKRQETINKNRQRTWWIKKIIYIVY